ncbi:hypothetical protein CKM354_001124700 [Cercospora kikuchii]|uniref:Uncharacterized protein n=1 Tax=Cercospora kikuchii TaxID=84275 RepID=A0A9P3CP76_9PEZI|nr:uncharacterized protein CKM354_001124700 [Cercospora kikuchii]GIZ48174.1 hypothetical protein CKM354_001124700 [Cercospora kikuchii]
MTHHHYALKYDREGFFKTAFLEIAMSDGSPALLYAIVAFAAYHHTVGQNNDDISTFLSYYNQSIAFLQQSLQKERHSIATLLTTLQLATIEEFLGDLVNLLDHRRAAYEIFKELFTPQTILHDETSRMILIWYLRFQLFAGMIPRGETILDRQWLAASAEFHNRQLEHKPEDLGAQFESYFATSRLLATDVAILFAGKVNRTISDEKFVAGIKLLSKELAEFGYTIEKAFVDTSRFPTEDLVTMNFVLIEHMAIDLMFKYQLAISAGHPPLPELAQIAIKQARLFDTIQYSHEKVENAVLSCRTSLGTISLFLPREERYNLWCRRKYARIEQLGCIYPEIFRKRMGDAWSEDVSRWWLPNDEGYPATIRAIREFVQYRATLQIPGRHNVSNVSGISEQ